MEKFLLDENPLTGVQCYAHIDGDDVRIQHVQDCSAIIEYNKMLQNDEGYSKAGMKEDWWHYAKIPDLVIMKWLQEEGVDVFNKDHAKKVFQLLNSPEYKYLKTTTKFHRG